MAKPTNGERLRYTPQEQRLLEVLKDGEEHPREELEKCLWDELANYHALNNAVSGLRAKLKAEGMDVVGRNGTFRQVRFLHFHCPGCNTPQRRRGEAQRADGPTG